MRRLLSLVAAVAVALSIPVVVAAATADEIAADFAATLSALDQPVATPAGGADVAVGNGTATNCVPPQPPTGPCVFGIREFRFAGASNLNSGEGHGHAHSQNIMPATGAEGAFVSGRVFCVSANGNQAVLGFIAEQGTQFPEGEAIYVGMVDNGRPGDPVPDLWGPFFITFGAPPMSLNGQCLPPEPVVATVPVTEGDIKVFDGQLHGSS